MLDIKRQKNIINDLLIFLRAEKKFLFKSNKKCTQDSEFWISKDFKFVISYLENYIKNNKVVLKDSLKPKGKILMMLSYNEPLILSIIPVLNALIAGNEIVLRPSSKAYEIVKSIWLKSEVIKKNNLNLEITRKRESNGLESVIKSVVAVYFFGGYETGKKIAKICAASFIEFVPEVEAADCMVVDFDDNDEISGKLVQSALYQSFSHAGQSCQRIHGVYVHKKNYNEFLKKLKNEFNVLCNSQLAERHVDKNYKLNNIYYRDVRDDIKNSGAREVIFSKKKMPALVIEPNENSDFIKKAYFLPILWLSVFNSRENLVKQLRLRRFFLGLNIMSDDKIFVEKIIDETAYSRYTINSSHIKIRDYEGWGGMWPSGFSGYKSWLHHFSNGYIKIEKANRII